MTPEKIKKFENALGAYSFGFQQDIIRYLGTLKQTGTLGTSYNPLVKKKVDIAD